ncbi:MAG: dihydrodipicolinate synthase family protein [Metallosphaera yellowstonensis]|jgi:Dihydrodipicolinate synthase/N-acetylneuraminate lyase
MKHIIVANVTPFDEKGEVDLNALKTLYEFDLKRGVTGFWVMGTTGELNMLSHEEKLKIAKVSVETAGDKMILGINEDSTYLAIRLAKEYTDMGATAIFSLPPIYHRPSEQGLFRFFEALSKPGVPLYVYNIPSYTGYLFPLELTKKLAREGIIQGMKYTTNDLVSFYQFSTAKEEARDFKLFIGSEHLILPSFMYGSDGAVTAVANFAPELVRALVDSYESGDWRKAIEYQLMVSKLGFAVGAGDYPTGVKIALRYRGVWVGRARAPLQEDINQEAVIYSKLKELGL